MLATLRIVLVLLAMFMLSEAVLSVERTGLPYLTILVDDSASEQIADQYEKPEVRTALSDLARSINPQPAAGAIQKPAAGPDGTPESGDGEGRTTRLAIAKGLILKDDARLLRELQKQYKVRIYGVSNSARPVAEVDRPSDTRPGRRIVAVARGRRARRRGWAMASARSSPSCGAHRLRRSCCFTDGQTTEGEPLSKAAELAARKGVPLYTIGLGSSEPARDLELTELLVDDVVFVDDAVRFQAKLLGPRASRARRSRSGSKSGTPATTIPSRTGIWRPRRSTPPATASPIASSWSIGPRPPASGPSSSRSIPGPASSRPTTTASSG